MNRQVFIFICAVFIIFSLVIWQWGCYKKPQPAELSEYSSDASTDSPPTDIIIINPTANSFSSTSTSSTQMPPQSLSAPEMSVPPATSQEEKKIAHNKDIQRALKNAGFYAGEIDGKIGPMSRVAIQDFQKFNDLTVDGKVGPKTWAELEKHLAGKNNY